MTQKKNSNDGFLPGSRLVLEATGTGPLAGLSFAAKDLFDIQGTVTGAGNKDWARMQTPAVKTADAVASLLSAGAFCCGKTISDELAFSLEGRNHQYGIPTNPKYPRSLPGGSSSGSASVVAAGLADMALGSDTGGSVRVPAAFCGIWGMRPSYGVVSTKGLMPFAPSYDTVGWFARDLNTLTRVGRVLLPDDPITAQSPGDILYATDALELVAPDVADAVERFAKRLNAKPIKIFPDGWYTLSTMYTALQAEDIRSAIGDEIKRIAPEFGPDIAPRFAQVLSNQADCAAMRMARSNYRDLYLKTLPKHTTLILPTSPVARLPRDGMKPDDIGDFYARALALNSVAGHVGAPQIHIPIGNVGMSILGSPRDDFALLNICKFVLDQLQ